MPAPKNLIDPLMKFAAEKHGPSDDNPFLKMVGKLADHAAKTLDDDVASALQGITEEFRSRGGNPRHAAMLAEGLVERILDSDGVWKKTEETLLVSLTNQVVEDIAAAPAKPEAIAAWIDEAGKKQCSDAVKDAFSTAILKSCEEYGDNLSPSVVLSALRLADEGSPLLIKDENRIRVKKLAERIIPAFETASDPVSAARAKRLMARLGPGPKSVIRSGPDLGVL